MSQIPTNIRTIEKRQTIFHSIVVVKFLYGFDHELRHERSGRIVNDQLTVTLDEQLILNESAWELTPGVTRKKFEVDRKDVGLIKIIAFGAGFFVRISVADVMIIKL